MLSAVVARIMARSLSSRSSCLKRASLLPRSSATRPVAMSLQAAIRPGALSATWLVAAPVGLSLRPCSVRQTCARESRPSNRRQTAQRAPLYDLSLSVEQPLSANGVAPPTQWSRPLNRRRVFANRWVCMCCVQGSGVGPCVRGVHSFSVRSWRDGTQPQRRRRGGPCRGWKPERKSRIMGHFDKSRT